MLRCALVGKPNSGKSSLFNLLTGMNQKVGNYSGVTVEKKTGKLDTVEITDLPGLKSLRSSTMEEEVARDIVLQNAQSNTPIVFVTNGVQLEDNLILFSEIADLQVPMIVVINFKDDLEKKNVKIDLEGLKSRLACPILLMNSRNGDGLDELKSAIKENTFSTPSAFRRSLYDRFHENELQNDFIEKFILDDALDVNKANEDYNFRQAQIKSIIDENIKELINPEGFLNFSKKLDKILLHPILGIFIFLAVMLVVFQSVFFLATFPMDWIDMFFGWASEQLNSSMPDNWVKDLITNGIIPGIGGVVIFIPQIAILFLLLGILEHSGYLSRISFIANRFLSNFGLSGQSVVPLMSSWACAIPAIMSTRIINNPRERFALIFSSPLMTCNARLPVYTILISIMYPNQDDRIFNAQGLLLLALYLIGVIATLLVAKFVYNRSKDKGISLFSLELPIYRIPNWRNVFYNVYLKTKSFVVEAGKIIFIVSILLWVLASFSPKSDQFIEEQYLTEFQSNDQATMESVKLEYSYAGYLGKVIEPVIEPLGYDWKIGIALISSFAAREVFVGTMATIYSIGSEEEMLIRERMSAEINPITGDKRFNTATCISLLLFYVFALQCMSTMAIVKKELGSWKYPIIQFIVMAAMAYISAFIAYTLLK